MKLLTGLLLVFTFQLGYSQELIRGYVTDSNNDIPIVGVTIMSDDTVLAISDDAGYFEFKARMVSDGFRVSHIGYHSRFIHQSEFVPLIKVRLEEEAMEIQGIVVQGFNNETALNKTSGPVALILRKELLRDNQTIIAPALNRIPGVFMQSGALNTNRITIRGVGSRSPFATQKIRAYLNEIPLTTGDGESTIEDIDMSAIQRVEVLKGPSSSIYGAGLGGVINLKAVKAAQNQNSFDSEISSGSYGLIRWVNRYQLQNQKVNLTVNLNTTKSDGYRDNNGYERNSAMILGQFYHGEKGVFTLMANLIHLKAFIPSSIDSATFASNPRASAPNWGSAEGFEDYDKGLFGISYKNTYSNGFRMNHALFYAFRDAMEQRPNPLGNLFEDSRSFGLRSKFGLGGGKLDIQGGFELFHERFDTQGYVNDDGTNGNELFNNLQNRDYNNLFVQLEYPFYKNLILTAGMNLNQTFYDFDNGNEVNKKNFEPVISPRIAIWHGITDNFSMYYSWSHGFSPPTFDESQTPNGNFNPAIEDESGQSFEIGARGKILSKLEYDVSVYTTWIRDLIVVQRDSLDQEVFQNAGKTRQNGIELVLKYPHYWENASLLFYTSMAFHDYKFDNFVDDGEDFSGNDLTGVPKSVLNAGIDASISKNWYGNLSFTYVNEMPIRDDNSLYSDAYFISSLKIGYNRPLGKHFGLDLSAGVNNLFDEKYASMISINAGSFGGNAPRYYYPGLPRNYFGSLKLTYNFTD